MKRTFAAAMVAALLAFAPAFAAFAQAPAKLALTDINTSPRNELEGLPGISRALSDAIVKGRPYRQTDDLVRKKIVPQSVYDAIKDRLITGF